jgi:hypothetical protein
MQVDRHESSARQAERARVKMIQAPMVEVCTPPHSFNGNRDQHEEGLSGREGESDVILISGIATIRFKVALEELSQRLYAVGL